jgi:hypothetical protein
LTKKNGWWENWAEYKQDAAIAFFGSDTSLLRKKYVSHGYSSFDDWNPVGYTIYQNKLFLLFCSLSIIVLSANMAGRKTGDSAIDRMSRYAAAGWLMRTMLVILLAATMTPTDWLVLPFSMECFLELFVLAGFLRLRPLLSLVFPKKRLDIAQTGFQ